MKLCISRTRKQAIFIFNESIGKEMDVVTGIDVAHSPSQGLRSL